VNQVLRIREVARGSQEFAAHTATVRQFAASKGVDLPPDAPYKTLGEWRVFLGGDTGQLTDPDGNSHTVSLAAWAEADPDATLLAISFVKYNPELYGPGKANPLPPDASG
jgi:hypothetical protein